MIVPPRQRNELTGIGCVILVVLLLILGIVSALAWGWVIMLVWGVMHAHHLVSTTIGYWPVGVLLGLLFSMLGTPASATANRNRKG